MYVLNKSEVIIYVCLFFMCVSGKKDQLNTRWRMESFILKVRVWMWSADPSPCHVTCYSKHGVQTWRHVRPWLCCFSSIHFSQCFDGSSWGPNSSYWQGNWAALSSGRFPAGFCGLGELHWRHHNIRVSFHRIWWRSFFAIIVLAVKFVHNKRTFNNHPVVCEHVWDFTFFN